MSNFVRILPILMLFILFTACGGQTAAPATPAEPAASNAEASGSASEPTSAPNPTNEPAASSATLQLLEETDTFRLIRHAGGETQVPLKPECIVVAGSGYLDHLLTLGVKPCGAAHGSGDGNFPDYLADQLAGVEYLGGTLEVNLEKVAVTKPDLILAMYPAHTEGEFATNFEPIAPTVYLTEPWVDWRQTLRELGLILGKQAEAEAALADFEARLAEARTELAATIGAEKVIFLRVLPAELRIYGTASPTGDLLFNRLGLTPSSLVPLGEENSSISMELIPEIDADHLFLLDQTEDGMAALKSSPLWQTILAVQRGNIYPVEVKIWIQGEGMQAYERLVADVEAALSNSEEAAAESTAASESEPTAAEAEPTTEPEAEVAEADAGAFPVTIEHKYGSTEITGKPERIVTVGLTEQDVLLALGVVPVGTTEWFGEYPGAIWPWAQEALGEAPAPEVVGDAAAVNYENIAGLKPDLILALYAGLTQEQYDLLSQIAPTVAQPGAYVDYGIPWEELTRTVGLAVGQAEAADQLVKDVEARFEQVQAEHPEFKGASSIVATPYEGIWVYGGEDVRGRFLTTLGFKLPEGLAEVTGEEFGGNLSFERADLLDVDVIIWLDADESQGPLGGPVYQNLAVHTEGREVHLDSYDDPLGGATSFVSVLSLPFLLDGLVPQLATALDKLPSEAQAE